MCCSDKWTCCCCCNVTKGAHVLAWFCLVIGILMVPALWFFLAASLFLFFIGLLWVLPYFTGIPIILGELRGKQTHRMYLPFLIVFGIGLVFMIFYGGADIFVKMNENVPNNSTNSSSVENNRTIKKADTELSKTTLHSIEIGSYFISWFLTLALNVWLYSIVLRAYFFVKRQNQNMNGAGRNQKFENIAL
ncbi:hypothetical protein niasHT_010856 [Heterodera trifolii]|uniref:Uncharacterized protein n=1 Tax=Heterodera trifolii TaxID=157864 RepID=A0ABD2LCY3_9BILA